MGNSEKMTGLEKFTRKNKDFQGQSSFSYGGRIKIAKPSSHTDENENHPEVKQEAAEQDNLIQVAPAQEKENSASTSGPANEAENQVPSAAPQAEPKRGKGRPKISEEEKQNKVVINFKVSRDLKTKLEELRLKTYRNSITDVMIEAISDVLNKYNME